MNPTSSPASGLKEETAAMLSLLDLLAREQACLAAGDADGCAALLEDKAAQVSGLTTLAAQRHRHLGALGFAASEEGMTDWLHASQHAPNAAQGDWQTLMDAARAAHEANRVNGMLLGQLAARNRQALDALGMRAAAGGLYGPGGQADYAAPRATHVLG